MIRYLLLDVDGTVGQSLAADVAQESDGLLTGGNLTDPRMQTLLQRGRPAWRLEPSLIEVDEDNIRVFTGFALRSRLIANMGIRRAWRVATVIARHNLHPKPESSSRRRIVKRSLEITAGIAGFALLGPTPNWVKAQATAERLRRPGRHSRREGVKNWKIRESAGGYRIRFQHRKPARSGLLLLTIKDNGTGVSFTIRRRSSRLHFTTNLRRGEFTVVDNNGDLSTGSFDRGRRQWDITDQSKGVLSNSRRDLQLGLAIASDLQHETTQSIVEPRVRNSATCRKTGCTSQYRQRASGLRTSRSLACHDAVINVNQKCTNRFCWGCCRLIGNDCDCICGIQDYLCQCGRSGDPCKGVCN